MARLASRSEGDPIVTACLDDPFEEAAAAAADMLATAFDLAALDLPLALPAALVFISLQLSPACANDWECNIYARAKYLMKDRGSKRTENKSLGMTYSGIDGWRLDGWMDRRMIQASMKNL